MTTTDDLTDIPTAGDKVDLHRDMAMLHARSAQNALHDLESDVTVLASTRSVLNQRIGVNLKLADVHARLAVAVAQSAAVGATHREVEL